MSEITLNRDNLAEVNATFALGSLVAAELYRTGQALIFFNIFDEVQIATKDDIDIDLPLPNPLLDGMDLETAVSTLINAKVPDRTICKYLEERSKKTTAAES